MKYLSILLLIICLSCNHSEVKITNKETPKTSQEIPETRIIISNKDKLKTLYLEVIRPIYTKSYKTVDIPTEFKIDVTDNSINAGAAFGYVEVSNGLVNCKDEYLQVFTLCHEVGHIVTINQAQKFNLGSEIPKGISTNAYKKAEYIADLIAFHLISENIPKYKDSLHENMNKLEKLLGHSDSYTHPSGSKRVRLLQRYEKESITDTKTFENLFEYIWKMD